MQIAYPLLQNFFILSQPILSKIIYIIFNIQNFFMLYFLLIFISQLYAQPTQKIHNIQIFGNASLGYYYSNFYIGTPIQRQSLILDTGSGIVALHCDKCYHCGPNHINPRFKISQSKTSQILTCQSKSKYCKKCEQQSNKACQFSVFYAQGSSYKGFYLEDYVIISKEIDQYYKRQNKSIQNQTVQNQIINQRVKTGFGCIQKQTYLFYDQKADGIIGLGPQRDHRLFEQLFEQHNQFTQQKYSFSLCLANSGGLFSIGGIDEKFNKSQKYRGKTKYNKQKGVYKIQVKQMSVKNKKLDLKQFQLTKTIFIDSGATLTYFPNQHYKLIVRQIDRTCISLDNCKETIDDQQFRCYHIISNNLQSQIKKFPNITIMFPSGQTVDWQASSYFLLRNRTYGEVCLGFVNFGRFILGATWMTDKNIYFDLKAQEIVFHDADCNANKSIKLLFDTQKPALKDQKIIILDDYLMIFVYVVFVIVILTVIAVIYTLIKDKKQQNRNLVQNKSQRQLVNNEAIEIKNLDTINKIQQQSSIQP